MKTVVKRGGVPLATNPANKVIQEKLTAEQYAKWLELMNGDFIEKMAIKSGLVNSFGGHSNECLAHFAVLILANMPQSVIQHD